MTENTKKTVLITGSNGFLGQKIVEQLSKDKNLRVIATSRGSNRSFVLTHYEYISMDILKPDEVKQVITRHRPDIIIHTAALTSVDDCENDRALCQSLNVDAVQTIASLCTTLNIHLIFLSTDFVFDGKMGPYTETDVTNPISVYGKSKLLAEKVVAQAGCKWTTLRTILVYGVTKGLEKSNIVLWAKNSLEKGLSINVVNDQWRMPTLAEDIAACCHLVIEQEARGLYHVSGKDFMSISELVEKVADHWHLEKSVIHTVSSDFSPQLSTRPKKTGFVLDKAINELGYNPHSFEEGLAILDTQLAAFKLAADP